MQGDGEGGGGGCGFSANEYSFAHGAQLDFGDLTPYLTYGENSSRNLFGGAVWRRWDGAQDFPLLHPFSMGGEMTEIVHRVDGGNQHHNYGFHIKASGAGQKAYKNPVRWVGEGGGEGGHFSLSLAVKSRWVIPP